MIPGSANPLLLATAAPTGYNIERSLRFNSSDSAYCLRTPSSNGTSYTTWTWSMWVKRSALGSGVLFSAGVNTQDYLIVNFDSNDTIRFLTGENGFTNQNFVNTAAVYRDFSAWYHLLVQADFGNATQADRIKIYVNGERQTISGTIAAQNYAGTTFNRSGIAHNIGRQGNGVAYFNGYLVEIHFIDGQALTPSSFAETNATTGQWVPKAYSGSYGTNGFRLTFSDNSGTTSTTLGKDAAGSNNWTPNNFSVATGAGNDSLVDTPTSYGTDTGAGGEVRGNYCTWNPLNSVATLANGNLDISATSQGGAGTISVAGGDFYCEITPTLLGALGHAGVLNIEKITPAILTTAGGSDGVLYRGDGVIYRDTGSGWGVAQTGLPSYTVNDVIGITYTNSSNTIRFYKNGTAVGSAITMTATVKYTPFVFCWQSSAYTANFGQRPFAYTAPSGFKALCDTNLPAPVVAKPSSVFNAITYTGTGANATIPNVNTIPTTIDFTPDLVWIKGRSGATDHALYDSVRDVQKDLVSNSTAAETTQSTGLTAFGTNTFNIGTLAKLNTSSSTYVGWCWDAGSSTVTNTQGSITSQVRANASAGFSVITFVCPTSGPSYSIGHGLGVEPKFIIAKDRSNGTTSWITYHASATDTVNKYLVLNGTGAVATASNIWGTALPSSTVINLTSNTGIGSGSNAVIYAFAPVAGYSSFGSYTSNTSATDGPFVYTGMRPRWILIRRSDRVSDWVIIDATRIGYNVNNYPLYPNLSNAEGITGLVDILSNGFKIRSNDTNVNDNSFGYNYIWAAFAENPFQYARAR